MPFPLFKQINNNSNVKRGFYVVTFTDSKLQNAIKKKKKKNKIMVFFLRVNHAKYMKKKVKKDQKKTREKEKQLSPNIIK